MFACVGASLALAHLSRAQYGRDTGNPVRSDVPSHDAPATAPLDATNTAAAVAIQAAFRRFLSLRPPTHHAPRSFSRQDDPRAVRTVDGQYLFRIPSSSSDARPTWLSDTELTAPQRRRARALLAALGLPTVPHASL